MTPTRPLLATGMLDAVLGGGLLPASVSVVIGPPGAGKTVLASQILFQAAGQGIPTLILTTASEGLTKLLEHLRGFTFFDETVVGSTLQVLAFQALVAPTLAETSAALMRAIRESGARLVLIDGWQSLSSATGEMHSDKSLLSILAAQVSYLGVTVLVTVAGDGRDVRYTETFTAVDAIINLQYTVERGQHQRALEVVKQRGHPHLPGLHGYRITRDGIKVLPQIELYPPVVHRPHPEGRYPFDLPELDTLLGGGLPAGSTTLVAGAPGVGKTVLALAWALAGARAGRRTLLLTFGEQERELRSKAAAFGLPLGAALEHGTIELVRLEPIDINPDAVAIDLLARLDDPTITQVIIDDIAFLLRAIADRGYRYFAAVRAQLYGRGITTVSLLEIDPFGGFQLNLSNLPVAVMADNLIVIQKHIDDMVRSMLAVLRMRTSQFDPTIRQIVLDAAAVQVLTPGATGAGVLSLVANETGSTAPQSDA